MIRDDYVSIQTDSHIHLVEKTEIGYPYSNLDDLNNIFRSKMEETNEFPGLPLKLVGVPLDQGKPILLDRIAENHTLFLVPDEDFAFPCYVEDP